MISNGPFRFSTELNVRWRDLDALGHVNNAVYFNYLEQARLGYMEALGFTRRSPSDVNMIIAEASCRYKSPLMLGERVIIRARVSQMRRSSFTFEYRIEGEDGRLVAMAQTVQVCYDYQAQHSIPIPDALRAAIVAYEPGLQQDRSLTESS